MVYDIIDVIESLPVCGPVVQGKITSATSSPLRLVKVSDPTCPMEPFRKIDHVQKAY